MVPYKTISKHKSDAFGVGLIVTADVVADENVVVIGVLGIAADSKKQAYTATVTPAISGITFTQLFATTIAQSLGMSVYYAQNISGSGLKNLTLTHDASVDDVGPRVMMCKIILIFLNSLTVGNVISRE